MNELKSKVSLITGAARAMSKPRALPLAPAEVKATASGIRKSKTAGVRNTSKKVQALLNPAKHHLGKRWQSLLMRPT